LIRQRVIASLNELANSLGPKAEGTQWHLFGSVDRDEPAAVDIDLLILCKGDQQADALRLAFYAYDALLPIHLALMTYEEAAEVDAIRVQRSRIIFPSPRCFT
jgi:predicted nucleotidyltransferase